MPEPEPQAVSVALDGSTPEVDEFGTRRRRVPSPRETANGTAAAYVFAPEVRAEEGPRVSVLERVREVAQTLDLRRTTAGASAVPLVVLALLAMISQLDQQTLNILLPDIRQDFGFNLQFLLTLGGALAIVSTVLAPLVGYLSDRVKRVWLLRIGAVIGNVSVAYTALATGVGGLILGRLMLGAGDALRNPVSFPLLTDYYPPSSRARVFSFLGVTTVIGLIGGPLIVGPIAQAFGWRAALLGMGSVATAVALLLFILREPVRGATDRRAQGASEEVANHAQRAVSWSEGWRAAASVRTLRRIWMVFPLVTVSAAAAIFLGFYYVDRFHVPVAGRAIISSVSLLPTLIGLPFLGGLTDRLLATDPGRVMRVLGGLFVVEAVSLVLLLVTPYLWLAVIISTIPTFCGSIFLPLLSSLVSLVVPARIRGLGLQTTAPFILVGQLLLPFFGGLADKQGIVYAMFSLVPVLLLAALILATGSSGVAQDIRAAAAASMADEEARQARQRGRNKMLICRDIDVTYDGAQVLFGVDLDVEEGEIVALLGTNGAGKSTLLRAIAGIQEASNGAIFLDGDDITHVPPHGIAAKGVVMMPGGRAIFPTLTVAENLEASAWLYRNDPSYVREQTDAVFALFPRLKDNLHTLGGDMSGGEQQMLALGQALLMRPRLLMIDELSLGLAPAVVETLLAVLRRIHAQGTTIIIVEQSVNVALSVADRAVYMERGEVKYDGPAADLAGRGDIVQSVFLSQAVSSSLGGQTRKVLRQLDATDRVLTVNDVHVRMGGVTILDGLSLELSAGQVVGIVGPNGAGKTTLFDVITGFVTPTSGTITLVNEDVSGLGADARARLGVARSYQNVKLFPALTVRENIAVALERHLGNRSVLQAAVWSPITRKVEARVARRVDNLVGSLGLQRYANSFLNELSTGTRRIVDIACLLAAQPKVLLLDEPTSGLAQAENEQLAPVIGRIVNETGCGILIIEHDLGLVAAVSDRLIAMQVGAVIASGPPGDVLDSRAVIDAILGGASQAVISRSVELNPKPASQK